MVVPKFRAWNTFHNKWVKHFYITGNGLIYNMEQPHRDLIGAVPIENSGLIVMQSTGLFDVNGKEIFEGDVVRLDSRHTMLVKYGRYYIEYEPNAYRGIGFYLITKDLPNPKYPVFPEGEYEIIGNIYQNPELMEATND